MEPHAWTVDSEPQVVELITVTSADGTTIAVERSGDGPPLVLVHGTAGDHGDWQSVQPILAEAFTIYAGVIRSIVVSHRDSSLIG